MVYTYSGILYLKGKKEKKEKGEGNSDIYAKTWVNRDIMLSETRSQSTENEILYDPLMKSE